MILSDLICSIIINLKMKKMKKDDQTQADLDNHSNQLNTNNYEYLHSRE